MQSSRALEPGTVVAGQWRVERMLGEGGFAVTYEARNTKTGQHVALKEYMPAGCCTRVPGSSVVTAAAGREGEVFRWGRERFMKEAETLARLDHPSIVRVAGYLEANGTAYMALAYEAGGTLKSWLERLGRAPTQAEFDAVLWPLLDALTQVHSLFLLHRDIKPDNILMRAGPVARPSGREPEGMGQPESQQKLTPVLIDFGATRSAIVGHTQVVGGANPSATSAFAIVSHGYSPPEQYDPAGRMVGPVSDIYALAATLHACLTGAPPPPAISRQFNDPYQPLARLTTLRGYRPEFLASIDQALALHPKDRPQSAVEFRRSIGLNEAPRDTSLAWRPTEVASAERGNRGSLPSVPPASFTGIESGAKRLDEKPPLRTGLLVAAGLALLALLGGGWWALVHVPQQRLRTEIIETSVKKTEIARQKAEADRKLAEAEAKRKAEEETAARRVKTIIIDRDGTITPSVPPSPAPIPESPVVGSGYVAVLLSRRSREDALKDFADLRQRFPDILQGREPEVRVKDFGDAPTGPKGVWYRLIVGPPSTRNASQEVCRKLAAQGFAGCYSVVN